MKMEILVSLSSLQILASKVVAQAVVDVTNISLYFQNKKTRIALVFLFVIFTFRLFTDPASIFLFGPSFFMPTAFFENTSLQSLLF